MQRPSHHEMSCRERDKVDTRLIIEGGRHIRPSKRVQGLDYPETITRLVKKTGQKEGKGTFHIFKSILTSMIQMVRTWFPILKIVEKAKSVTLIH